MKKLIFFEIDAELTNPGLFLINELFQARLTWKIIYARFDFVIKVNLLLFQNAFMAQKLQNLLLKGQILLFLGPAFYCILKDLTFSFST